MEDSKNNEKSDDIMENENVNTSPAAHRSSPSSPDGNDVAIEASIGANSGVEPEENDAEQGDNAEEGPEEKDVGQEDDDAGSETGSYSLSPGQLETGEEPPAWPVQELPTVKEWNRETSKRFDERGNLVDRDEYCRPDPSDVAVSWTAPLSKPLRTIIRNNVEVDMQTYPFLAGLLCNRRSLITLPFLTRHRLIVLILYTIQDSCYDFMKSKYPEQLLYTQIQCVDQIDIFDWTALIGGVRAQNIGFLNEVWPSLNNSHDGPLTVGHVRQVAYHREDYDNRLILYAVCLLVQLEDHDRLTKIQTVLQMLYQKQCQAESINPEHINPEHKFLLENEMSTAEAILDIDSRLASMTQQQMLSKIQTILERSFFRLAFAHNPGYFQQRRIDCAEKIELQEWSATHSRVLTDSIVPAKLENFPSVLESARLLRNQASHPSFDTAFDRKWANWAITILGHCDDEEAIAQINRLAVDTEAHVEEATRARVDSYPNDVASLLELYNECKAARANYLEGIHRVKSWDTQHEKNILNIFDNAKRDFRERYEQALKAETGEGTSATSDDLSSGIVSSGAQAGAVQANDATPSVDPAAAPEAVESADPDREVTLAQASAAPAAEAVWTGDTKKPLTTPTEPDDTEQPSKTEPVGGDTTKPPTTSTEAGETNTSALLASGLPIITVTDEAGRAAEGSGAKEDPGS